MRHNRNNVPNLSNGQSKQKDEAFIEQYNVNVEDKALQAVQRVTRGIHNNNLKELYHGNLKMEKLMEPWGGIAENRLFMHPPKVRDGWHYMDVAELFGKRYQVVMRNHRSVLRATTACTFSTSTSKSGPGMVCFVHFDFDMCFAPQRRALFRHLNFQKWSEHGVLCTF